jgi:hypothetical protein
MGNLTHVSFIVKWQQTAEWGHTSSGGMSPIGMVALIDRECYR